MGFGQTRTESYHVYMHPSSSFFTASYVRLKMGQVNLRYRTWAPSNEKCKFWIASYRLTHSVHALTPLPGHIWILARMVTIAILKRSNRSNVVIKWKYAVLIFICVTRLHQSIHLHVERITIFGMSSINCNINHKNKFNKDWYIQATKMYRHLRQTKDLNGEHRRTHNKTRLNTKLWLVIITTIVITIWLSHLK